MTPPSGERPPTEALLDFALRSAFTTRPPPPKNRPPDATLPPERVCRVEAEIARGGMGVVYRARDPALGREVALKLLREDLAADDGAVRRFLEEARVGGRLQHPGVVPVYALGRTATGRPWFTMKLIEGRTFASMLQSRGSPAQDLRRHLAILESVCRTIAFAHDRGVVHLDLKPGNVMVGAFGEVQVVDWGLAALVRSSEPGAKPRHNDGEVYGTPAYMPPEQARGEFSTVDERADVFALGAILCEVLTGTPPYAGGREASRRAAADAELESAIERLRTCDTPDLAALCAECLEASPERRRADAGGIAFAIARHFATLEERLRGAEIATAEARTRAEDERRARKLTLALAGSVLFSIVLGIAIVAWLAIDRGQRRRAVDARASLALEEAARLFGQAESSSDEETFQRAATAAVRAQTALADGEGSPSLEPEASLLLEHIRSAEASARERRERERADRALLARLDALRVPDDEFDDVGRDRSYVEAFRAAGLDPDAGSIEDFATEVRARGSAVAIASAFDEWIDVREAACRFSGAERLRAISRIVDPDPNRVEVRRWLARGPDEGLDRLLDREDLSALGPGTVHAIGRAIYQRCSSRVGGFYRIAHRAHPTDPTIAVELARLLFYEGHLAEGESVYRIALSLRPEDPTAHQELAWELDHLDIDHAAAVELARRATELVPDDFVSHFCLGHALRRLGDLDGAVAAQTAAARLRPGDDRPHKELAILHGKLGDKDMEIEELRAIVARSPSYLVARVEFAQALAQRGRVDEALAEIRRVIEIDAPARGRAEQIEGRILLAHGDFEEAARILRSVTQEPYLSALPLFESGARLADFLDLERIETECEGLVRNLPFDPECHCRLGVVLEARGRCGEAVAELRTGHLLGAHQQGWERPSAAWLAEAECLAIVERKLDGLLEGTIEVESAGELRDLGILAARRGLAEPAARWLAGAFERDPASARTPNARLEAACAAVRAGGAAWRARALAWFREELEDPSAKRSVGPWKIARELESVRDPAALEALPPAEREAWRAAWELARR